MTFFLVFLAILAAGTVVVMALGRFSRVEQQPGGDEPDAAWRWERGEVPAVNGLAEPVANLPPVLLPNHPSAADVDRLRFSSGFRGYRMDQVDEVLDLLRDEIAARDDRIAELEEAARRNGPSGDEPGVQRALDKGGAEGTGDELGVERTDDTSDDDA